MIYADHTLRSLIEDGILRVDPHPTDEQFQPASLDVRLGEKLYHVEKDKTVTSPQHRLQPGERYLGHTKEEITLPPHIAAQLAGRSTIGRMGVIVHKTAGWIDPGFSGEITLELMNLGSEPVDLKSGQRVAQLVFFKMMQTPKQLYDGHYQHQTGPTTASNQ